MECLGRRKRILDFKMNELITDFNELRTPFSILFLVGLELILIAKIIQIKWCL